MAQKREKRSTEIRDEALIETFPAGETAESRIFDANIFRDKVVQAVLERILAGGRGDRAKIKRFELERDAGRYSETGFMDTFLCEEI